MLHISIPGFQTLLEKSEPHKKYHVYELYVNGAYHASARYSALYALHERLLETFGVRLDCAEFPPKRIWFNLDAEAANKRREGLARYFQSVLRNPDIARHSVLERHFLEFQVKSFMPAVSGVRVEVFLPSGQPIHIECHSDDNTSVVTKRVCNFLEVADSNAHSFGLFLSRARSAAEGRPADSTAFDQVCVRWLRNFESPFISQQIANRSLEEEGLHYQLTLRRVVWEPRLEEALLDDAGALELLFQQAAADLERGLVRVPAAARAQLEALRQAGQKRAFLHLCHQQADYGFELLPAVRCDFPRPGSLCDIKVGRHQLVFEYEDSGSRFQSAVRSTRIRVWRVSQNDQTRAMSFQVEFLLERDQFHQVTMQTEHSVLLALFLQSVAAEILRENNDSTTSVFPLDDDIPTRVIESLESSKASSVVGEADGDPGLLLENGALSAETARLMQMISFTMPFENESFEDITDADL